jgi:hypothetical protein
MAEIDTKLGGAGVARSTGSASEPSRAALIHVSEKSVLLADLVDGMNYTPRQRAYEDMRNGILDGLAASGNSSARDGVECVRRVRRRYPRPGITKGTRAIANESFDVPAACQP